MLVEADSEVQLAVGETVDVSAVEAQTKGLTEASAGRQLFALVAACRDAGKAGVPRQGVAA